MKRVLTGVLALLVCGPASADEIEVDSFHVGGFYAPAEPPGAPLTPDNDPIFQNYFMGHTTVGGFTTTERRAFFAFDLGGVPLAPDEIIVSATLVLENVFGGVLANFTADSELAVFTATTTPYDAIADPTGAGVSPDEIFETFGTGEFYGELGWTPDGPLPGAVGIDLSPTGIGDMMAAMTGDDPFVISGMMASYDPESGALFEFVFGLTDVVVDGIPTDFPVPKLVITTAPIPAPGGALVAGAAALLAFRRRRSVV